ncbi:hypothetical protein LCGC14_1410550 [marine sediment metagenome]|uniref:Uncharacterized protein n=1 Tax=marine sediment metagenome TaxID=412755 RepID=A0A0F9JUG7_9ZZZZ
MIIGIRGTNTSNAVARGNKRKPLNSKKKINHRKFSKLLLIKNKR